jgi:hypothetical protein
MRGRTGVTVGACLDKGWVRNNLGGTASVPCSAVIGGELLQWCIPQEVESWKEAANAMRQLLQDEWQRLVTIEEGYGASPLQTQLEARVHSTLAAYDKLPGYEDGWFCVDCPDPLRPVNNATISNAIVSWMMTASCVLQDVQAGIRTYRQSPSGVPSDPSFVPVAPPATTSKPLTQTLGEGTLLLMGVGLLAAGLYVYKRGSSRARSVPARIPLPPLR